MYFSKFPYLIYSLDDGKSRFVIRDLFRRVKADQVGIEDDLAYYDYIIRDGDTPEILADKIYDNSEFHWIILIVNEIIDPRWDWPLPENVLYDYVVSKYGLTGMNNVHHYVNSDGYVVHSNYVGKIAVSNYEYEVEENEKKRTIRMLKPQYVNLFVKTFTEVAAK